MIPSENCLIIKKKIVYSSTSTECQGALNSVLKRTLYLSITAVRRVENPSSKLKSAEASITAISRVNNPSSKLKRAEKNIEKLENSQYIPSYSLYPE